MPSGHLHRPFFFLTNKLKAASTHSYHSSNQNKANTKYPIHATYLPKLNLVLLTLLIPCVCFVTSHSMTYASTLITRQGNKLGRKF